MRKLMWLVVLVSVLVLGADPAPAQAQQFCANPTHSVTSVGLSAVTVPAAALTGRRYIQICNSQENAANPLVKCRSDGTNPQLGSGFLGDTLLKGDCIVYENGSGTPIKCIADTASTAVSGLECT